MAPEARQGRDDEEGGKKKGAGLHEGITARFRGLF